MDGRAVWSRPRPQLTDRSSAARCTFPRAKKKNRPPAPAKKLPNWQKQASQVSSHAAGAPCVEPAVTGTTGATRLRQC